MHIKRSTALIASLALVVSAVVGFALGNARSKSHSTSNFHNSANVAQPFGAALGFYPGYASVALLQSLEMFTGRSAGYVVQFSDDNPTNFTGSVWGEVISSGALQTIANRMTLVESIPLAFGPYVNANTSTGQATARTSLQATVNGANDARYTVAAKYLLTGGYGDAIIRLGWEFDGGWYPWSSKGNEALWATAYRHVADIFRGVSPDFRFDWNGTQGYIQTATAAYPGNAYVDSIGLDVYDKGLGVAWNTTTKSWTDPTAAFNVTLASLKFQRDFAIAHGKQVSYPEWALTGVTTTVTSKVGGDSTTFIQGMYDFMRSLPASGPGSLLFHSYFNSDTQDGNHKINAGHFPKASARFQSLFGAADVPTTTLSTPPTVFKAPDTTVAPTTVAPTTTTTKPPATATLPAPTTTTTVEATFSITVTCGVVTHKCSVPPGLTGP